MRIRDPGWRQFGSEMEKSRIRDKHPGSATLFFLPVNIRREKAQVDRILHKTRYIPLHQVDDGHSHGLRVLIIKNARIRLTASSTSPGTFPCIMWTMVMVMVSVS
jgi:hypothetical protein